MDILNISWEETCSVAIDREFYRFLDKNYNSSSDQANVEFLKEFVKKNSFIPDVILIGDNCGKYTAIYDGLIFSRAYYTDRKDLVHIINYKKLLKKYQVERAVDTSAFTQDYLGRNHDSIFFMNNYNLKGMVGSRRNWGYAKEYIARKIKDLL